MTAQINLKHENPLLGFIHGLSAKEHTQTNDNKQSLFLAVSEVTKTYCNSKYIYSQARKGRLTLYRLGHQTFVRGDQFFALFKEIPPDAADMDL